MLWHTALTQRLGLDHPIIQAPLAGGGDTPALVAAVCEAGALGCIGAAYLTPAQIVEAARAVRARTARPFGINLFAPLPTPALVPEPGPALARLAPFYAELGLPPPTLPASEGYTFDEQLAVALDSGAAVFSFTFGILPAHTIEAIKGRGMLLLGTATTVEEAVVLAQAGVDAIVTQGSEAGGHRGTFATTFDTGMVGTLALVPQVVDAVRVPVIAAGGIVDRRGVVAALALGASAVQVGTAYLFTPEAKIHAVYRAALNGRDRATAITNVFTGRPARGIVNRLMRDLGAMSNLPPPFPTAADALAPLRRAAEASGRDDFSPLWAGESFPLAKPMSAAALTRLLGSA